MVRFRGVALVAGDYSVAGRISQVGDKPIQRGAIRFSPSSETSHGLIAIGAGPAGENVPNIRELQLERDTRLTSSPARARVERLMREPLASVALDPGIAGAATGAGPLCPGDLLAPPVIATALGTRPLAQLHSPAVSSAARSPSSCSWGTSDTRSPPNDRITFSAASCPCTSTYCPSAVTMLLRTAL